MKRDPLPDTVQAIIAQAGGLGLRRAFVHVAAGAFTDRSAEPLGEYQSSRSSRPISEGGQGFVDENVGPQCRVNGKRSRAWALIIALEPNEHPSGLERPILINVN